MYLVTYAPSMLSMWNRLALSPSGSAAIVRRSDVIWHRQSVACGPREAAWHQWMPTRNVVVRPVDLNADTRPQAYG